MSAKLVQASSDRRRKREAAGERKPRKPKGATKVGNKDGALQKILSEISQATSQQQEAREALVRAEEHVRRLGIQAAELGEVIGYVVALDELSREIGTLPIAINRRICWHDLYLEGLPDGSSVLCSPKYDATNFAFDMGEGIHVRLLNVRLRDQRCSYTLACFLTKTAAATYLRQVRSAL